MIGEHDITLADRAKTLVKAAAYCAAGLIGAAAFVVVLGLAIEFLEKP